MRRGERETLRLGRCLPTCYMYMHSHMHMHTREHALPQTNRSLRKKLLQQKQRQKQRHWKRYAHVYGSAQACVCVHAWLCAKAQEEEALEELHTRV